MQKPQSLGLVGGSPICLRFLCLEVCSKLCFKLRGKARALVVDVFPARVFLQITAVAVEATQVKPWDDGRSRLSVDLSDVLVEAAILEARFELPHLRARFDPSARDHRLALPGRPQL